MSAGAAVSGFVASGLAGSQVERKGSLAGDDHLLILRRMIAKGQLDKTWNVTGGNPVRLCVDIHLL